MNAVITRYKTNIEKSIVLLYTSNKHINPEIKNTVRFTISQKKYLDVNVNRTHIGLYDRNYKMLMKENKDNFNREIVEG